MRAESPTEEDLHCAKMRELGAKRWESKEYWFLSNIVFLKGFKISLDVVFTGWPDDGNGGVWVLKAAYKDAVKRGIGRVSNALNMKERCDASKSLGGKFYSDPHDCPDLALR
ncbi:hypothetical protein BBP40_006901 [Aspergillus hancockii]|nr:hypothetical protein BBP40_006901 [Aspergillus hancockii]